MGQGIVQKFPLQMGMPDPDDHFRGGNTGQELGDDREPQQNHRKTDVRQSDDGQITGDAVDDDGQPADHRIQQRKRVAAQFDRRPEHNRQAQRRQDQHQRPVGNQQNIQ